MNREAQGGNQGEGYWSPAPVVYGKVNRKLSQKSQSIPRRLLLSSRPQHDGSTGGLERARKEGGGEEQNVKFRLEDCGSREVGVFSTPG